MSATQFNSVHPKPKKPHSLAITLSFVINGLKFTTFTTPNTTRAIQTIYFHRPRLLEWQPSAHTHTLVRSLARLRSIEPPFTHTHTNMND